MRRIVQFNLSLLLIFGSLMFILGYEPSLAQTEGDPPSEPQSQKVFLPLVGAIRLFNIRGQVTGTGGQPVSGVSIVDQNGRQAITNEEGLYLLGGLVPGYYTLAADKAGMLFNPAVAEVELGSVDKLQDFSALTACSDVIINGSFETNDAWQLPATQYTASFSNAAAHTGSRSVSTGITDPSHNRYSYSSARQMVTIPANTTSANLRLWLYPLSGEMLADAANLDQFYPLEPRPSGTDFESEELAGDAQYVLILDPGFNPIDPADDTLLETLLWMRSNAGQWQVYDFNITRYAGRTIKIQLGTYNDGYGGISAMYADDISLELCDSVTTPPPPTPTCTNYIANPGFEYYTHWGIPVTEYPAGYSTARAFSGLQSMRTGIVNPAINRYSYSDAYQVVTIPGNATQAKLGLHLYMQSGEVTSTGTPDGPLPNVPTGQVFGETPLASDVQYVLVLNQYGYILETLLWTRQDTISWGYWEFDLLKYRGQTIRLQFGTYNDGWGGITAMYADDVILDVCDSISPPTPTPPPPGTCTEVFTNNSFESNSAWGIPITQYTAGYSTVQAHSGVRSMRTGILYAAHNRFSYSDAYQSTSIPLASSSATLGMYLNQRTSESTNLALMERPTSALSSDQVLSGDVQYVLILDGYGNWIDTLLWQRKNTQTWNYHQFNLDRYSGSYVRVQFGTYNDGWGGVTSMYVDDASFLVCP
jgi:hypothetical protein